MDGQLNNTEVMCCFCGLFLSLGDAAIIIIKPNIESAEQQQLFSHKQHLVENISTSIPLHPDFFEDED